ncbi:MAG: hypothetical protein GY716_21815 [bacterium]|nr:hypothetical protein [bacterium]
MRCTEALCLKSVTKIGLAFVALVALTALPSMAQAPCVVPDNGTGTVHLPPQGCGYVSPDEFHVLLEGVPSDAKITIDASHEKFFQVQRFGDPATGETEDFQSILILDVQGEGSLSGFQRFMSLQIHSVVDTGPRPVGAPVQTFSNEMLDLQGELFGDPDFCTFRISGGSSTVGPSGGSTTLTQLPSGNFNVDSFFDITYQIEFQGCPGSILDGMGGTTEANVRMSAGVPDDGCDIPPGDDIFPSTAKLVLQLDNQTDPIVVRLSSANQPPAVVHRGPKIGNTIDTEILSMELVGHHPDLGGEIRVRQSATQPSLGQLTNIQQSADCSFIQADSFFDVVVDIDLVGTGETWHCDRPLHIERRLTSLPPKDEPYENPFLDPVTVLDQFGNPRGQILYEVHHVDPPLPPPGEDCFDTWLFANVDIPQLGLFNQPIMAEGPTTVHRGPASTQQGVCSSDGTPCLTNADCPLPGDTCVSAGGGGFVQTEMIEMTLSGHVEGIDPPLPIQVRLNQDQPTQGHIQSRLATRAYPIDSFFDVMFEVEVEGLPPLRNQQHLVVSNIGSSGKDGVSNIPPDPDTPFLQQGPQDVALFLGNQPFGAIRNVQHIVHPPYDWQPPPPPDEDCFDSWIHLRIVLEDPISCVEEVWLNGHFRVLRDAPRGAGTAGQEIIDTIMAKGEFSGAGDCLGNLVARMSPNEASEGAVSSLAPAEFFPADSFFDIYVDIDMPDLGTKGSAGPNSMTTTINKLPPDDGEIYFGPGTIIPLYDDAGNQIGFIEELEHEVHAEVECPDECLPRVVVGALQDAPDSGFAGVQVFSKNVVLFGINNGGGGVGYDLVRGDLSTLRSTSGSYISSVCLVDDGGPEYIDGAIPGTGDGYYYLSRDGYKAFTGTFNNKGAGLQGDRDAAISACTP